jgi:hypothetical protein
MMAAEPRLHEITSSLGVILGERDHSQWIAIAEANSCRTCLDFQCVGQIGTPAAANAAGRRS